MTFVDSELTIKQSKTNFVHDLAAEFKNKSWACHVLNYPEFNLMLNCFEECRATTKETINKDTGDFLLSVKKPVSLICETGSRLVRLVQRTLPIFLV